jgi:hypothetical protein
MSRRVSWQDGEFKKVLTFKNGTAGKKTGYRA